MTQWAQEGTRRLAQRQAAWKENCEKSATYAAHPTKPMTLDAAQVRNTARTLRLTSDLPFLYTIAYKSGQKWDNLTIQKANFGIAFDAVEYVSAIPKVDDKDDSAIYTNWIDGRNGVAIVNVMDKTRDRNAEEDKFFPSEIFWQPRC